MWKMFLTLHSISLRKSINFLYSDTSCWSCNSTLGLGFFKMILLCSNDFEYKVQEALAEKKPARLLVMSVIKSAYEKTSFLLSRQVVEPSSPLVILAQPDQRRADKARTHTFKWKEALINLKLKSKLNTQLNA